MKYKITIKDKKYLVEAADAKTALSAIAELFDSDGINVSYWLDKGGISKEQRSDMSSEQKRAKAEELREKSNNQEKTSETHNSSQPSKASVRKPGMSFDTENAKRTADKYKQFASSPDVKALVKKIDNKQYIPLEELRKHPAIRQMEEIIHEYDESIKQRIIDNGGVAIPLDEQEQIKEELLSRGSVVLDENGKAAGFEGPVKYERKAVIVIGLPASGKSTNIVDIISGPMSAVVIDSDEAKFLSKEFQETDGVAANAIHSDSQNIIKQVFDEHRKTGANMIIPVIGSDYDKLYKKWIDKLESDGYDVEIQFQDAKPVDAANRVIARAVGKGRPMSSDIIFGYGDKPRDVFKQFEGKTNAQGKPYTNRSKNNV